MYCPKCSKELKQVIRKQITDKDLKKPYFFSMWFKCSKCNYIKLMEDYKIFNNTSEFAKVKMMRNLDLID